MTWIRSRKHVAEDAVDDEKTVEAEKRAQALEIRASFAEAVLRSVLAARHGDPWTAPIVNTIHHRRRGPNV